MNEPILKPISTSRLVCPCGAHKGEKRIVCPECWSSAPLDIRQRFHTGSAADGRGPAIRALLDHAASRSRKSP